jgi:5-methyltetrahydrofolate--homocysteine methyltransferase
VTNRDFMAFCRERLAVCDGAMGTCLARAGLSASDYGGHPGCHEILNLTRPDVVAGIHRQYLEAGADIIETNSFGGASHILAEHGLEAKCREINRAAAALARLTADGFEKPGQPRFVAGSMGPGSKLPSLGQASYQELAASYRLQAQGLIEGGADILIIETCQDLLQIKAVLAAVREVSADIPVMAQVTLDENGRTLTGSDIAAVLAALEPLPLQGIGLNCGLGPEGMAEAVRYLARYSSKLLSVMPNAGLPKMRRGAAVYHLSPGDFARQMKAFASGLGLNIAGGCCGTEPGHIAELARAIEGIKPRKTKTRQPRVSSLFHSQDIRQPIRPLIVGERTNASGSKRFRQLLEKHDHQGMAALALEQEREGAHLIDLSLASAGQDEAADMDRVCFLLNTSLKTPVMLDCTDPKALEAGLRRLAGRSVVNSFNLEDGGKKGVRILALCRLHGAAAVGMAIDRRGMAATSRRKLEVADQLVSFAARQGLAEQDLFLDLLTFTLASGQREMERAGLETLDALAEVKRRHPGCFTILGVSNISYGLPAGARTVLNSVFLSEALGRGLDAAIMHAGKIQPLNSIDRTAASICRSLIYNRDYQGRRPLPALLEHFQKKGPEAKPVPKKKLPPGKAVRLAIIQGDQAAAVKAAGILLEKSRPQAILSQNLLPAMDEVGRLFKTGRMQLPFVLRSAEAMKAAMAVLAPKLGSGIGAKRGTLVLATVRGDIHDIGKDLVDMILSANGYRVVNLGVKRTPQDIMSAVKKHKPEAVGLSGLLVESARAMGEYLEVLASNGLRIPVICGGAALSRRYVESDLARRYPGRVYYAADAMEGLKIMGQICRGTRGQETRDKVQG